MNRKLESVNNSHGHIMKFYLNIILRNKQPNYKYYKLYYKHHQNQNKSATIESVFKSNTIVNSKTTELSQTL